MQVQAKRMPPQVQDDGAFRDLMDTSRFEQMQRVATVYAASKIVPEHYRGNAADCFIGLHMALRMGVDPIMFFQNSYMVHGKPGFEAKFAIALINSSGLFTDSLDYEIEGGTDPFAASYKARAVATRKSTGKVVQGPWVDWKMVKAEQWDSKPGSKWKTMPGVMFLYRAAMFFGRLACPERLMGMQTVDELVDVGGEQVVPAVTQRGTKALLTKIKNLQTDRPVSEGQTLVNTETGEEIPTPSEGASGATNEVLERQIDDEAAQEAPVESEGGNPDPMEALAGLSIEDFKAECYRVKSATLHKAEFESAFKGYLMGIACLPPKFGAMTLAQKKELFTAFQNGRIDSKGKFTDAS